jgi:hypothetical protein
MATGLAVGGDVERALDGVEAVAAARAAPPDWVRVQRRRHHMYAVIRAYSGNRDLADTLAERKEEIQQVIGGINGFKAYYLLKLAEGTSTISVFEDQAGAEESSRAAAAWLVENLPDLNVAAPYVTSGEVLVRF